MKLGQACPEVPRVTFCDMICILVGDRCLPTSIPWSCVTLHLEIALDFAKLSHCKLNGKLGTVNRSTVREGDHQELQLTLKVKHSEFWWCKLLILLGTPQLFWLCSVPACPCRPLLSVSLAYVSVTEKKITPLAQFYTQDTKMMLNALFSLPNQREGSCMMEDDSVDIENENGNRFEEYEWCGQKRIRATTLLEGGFRGKRGIIGGYWDVLGPKKCMYLLSIWEVG